MNTQKGPPKKSQELAPGDAYTKAIELVEGIRNSSSSEINFGGLETLDKLPPLHGLPQVRGINLQMTKVADLSALSQLPTLESLNINQTKVSDFSVLTKLTAIESLSMNATSFADLHLLSKMSSLRVLLLANTKVVDLSPISTLRALRRLNLNNTNVADISALSNSTALYALSLEHTKITDLRPLIGLEQLRELELWNCPIVDFSPLSELTNLGHLELWGTQFSDLSILGGLQQLRWLDIDSTNVTDFNPLTTMRSLDTLYLSKTKIADLTPLAKISGLETVSFEDTDVSDLRPLARLINLKNLRFSSSKVADLSPLADLKALTTIEFDNTPVSDLSPLIDLRGLTRAALSGRPFDGISFRDCPLDDPFLKWLADRDNPERTIDAIAYLRRSKGLPPLQSDHEPSIESLPEVPSQVSGPHFAVREDGVLTFASPEALDRDGNNISQLRVLHPPLTKLAQELAVTLSGGNVPYPHLNERIQSYLSLVNQQLSSIPFDRLYVEGVRLQNTVNSTRRQIEEKELPPFDLSTRERLDSLLQLHGTFMLSTAVGLELIGAEQRYRRNPPEERALRDAAREFAEQLQDRPDIAHPEAARFILKAVEDVADDKNPERSAIVATNTAKNAAIVVISAATIGALPVVGAAVAGPVGLVGGGLAALIGVEGLKRSKSFLMIAGILTSGLDQLKDADLQQAIEIRARTLAPYVGFVLNAEPILRRLGNLGPFEWLPSSLDWLKEHAGQSRGNKPSQK